MFCKQCGCGLIAVFSEKKQLKIHMCGFSTNKATLYFESSCILSLIEISEYVCCCAKLIYNSLDSFMLFSCNGRIKNMFLFDFSFFFL